MEAGQGPGAPDLGQEKGSSESFPLGLASRICADVQLPLMLCVNKETHEPLLLLKVLLIQHEKAILL